jgi:hypothetical protein
MALVQKVRLHLARMRRVELTRCKACQIVVLVRQLGDHQRERCPGQPYPPGSQRYFRRGRRDCG